MLDFFRKYQRYFFLGITIVIIISFSFFGTYNTLSENPMREQTAFTAVDGSRISRADLDEMVVFISTDNDDKTLYGGVWGPNFLNDGVLKKDLLQTGLAKLLAMQYTSDLQGDLQTRLEKEKRYTPYSHPQAKFINAEMSWTYFAPELKSSFEALRAASEATDSQAFENRVKLYLAEKKFPSPLLRQVLRYQEKQYNWLPSDINLDRIDLSLFGYHTVDDWFGPRFIRLSAEFIINSAKIAESKGYKVSKEEALSDLYRNAEKSFQENLHNPHLAVTNSSEYITEQLRRMGMDQTKAVKVWRQVLLFRRMFQDEGNAVLVDAFPYQKYNGYAKETVETDLYQLPEKMRLNSYRALQKMEAYLNAVSQRPQDEKNILMPPQKFLSAAQVAKNYPELVQKKYLLDIAHVDKKTLEPKAGVKETWNWEVEDNNWNELKKQFPDLGVKKGDTREDRFAALDSLDELTRSKVDAYARAAIVNAHPEWLETALQDAPSQRSTVGLSRKGGTSPFAGLENRQELIKLLDAAPLGEQVAELSHFSADQKNYYRIAVIDRDPKEQILTFEEADETGLMGPILKNQLEAYYVKARENDPKEFQKEDKTWKPLAEVQDSVADLYFAKTLKAIRTDYLAAIAPEKPQQSEFTGDYSASLRFFTYMREIEKNLQKDPQEAEKWLSTPSAEVEANKLPPQEPLEMQWKLLKTAYKADRTTETDNFDKAAAFSMAINAWSKVYAPANGDLYFFRLNERKAEADATAVLEKVGQARKLLSDAAQQALMESTLSEIKEKSAISLEYMNQTDDKS